MQGDRWGLTPTFLACGQLLSAVFLLVGFLLPGDCQGGSAPEVLRIRYFSGPRKTRIVLDLSQAASYEVREIDNPCRLVVNLPRCTFAQSASIVLEDGLVERIRRNPGKTRAQVVLDLVEKSDFHSFSLPGSTGKPHRVVLDILRPEKKLPAPPIPASVPAAPDSERPFVVVIDPGHGGLDPGAVRNKTEEKDVVLAVSRELVRLLNSLPGYQAVLTRQGDYYPSLGRRVEIAAEKHGDLFLSVHCNTHKKKAIQGMEVYFLSLQGATNREAGELADKENAADLVGLDQLRENDDWVVGILMDMRMTRILHQSARLADHLLESAEASQVVNKRKAKQAGFQVLKSLAMPSALVEIAYLSNSRDFKLLKSKKGKDQLALVLAEGIVSWRNDRSGLALLKGDSSTVWAQEYAVRKGDSLWGLAHRHRTTIQEIFTRNQLHSEALTVGQVLRLPRGVLER